MRFFAGTSNSFVSSLVFKNYQKCNGDATYIAPMNKKAMKKILLYGIWKYIMFKKRRQTYETHRTFDVGTPVNRKNADCNDAPYGSGGKDPEGESAGY